MADSQKEQQKETESSMYRKLAEEYSKLKAHYQVLKKLLVETRSEKESLTSVLKTKEQDIRKLTQEQESLQFLNGQLNKRVEVLQNNLAETQKNDKKRKGGSGASNTAQLDEKIMVLENELMSKIKENEDLHFTIETLQSEHRKLVSELTDKVKSYQSRNVLQLTHDATENLENKMVIEELKKTNEVLTKQVESLKFADSMDSKSRSVSVDTAELISKPINGFLSANENNFETSSIASSSKFSDAVTTSAVAPSVSKMSISERPQGKNAKEVFVSLGVFSDQFLSSLSTWHCYERDRIAAYDDSSAVNLDLANAHSTLSSSIKDSVSNFRQFTLTLTSDDNTAAGESISTHDPDASRLSFSAFLMPFLLYLSGVVKITNEVVNYFKSSENERSYATDELKKKNEQLALHYAQISKCFKQMHNVLSDFPSTAYQNQNAELFILQLKNCFTDLRNEYKALSKNLNQKIRIEHQIDGVNEKVKTANECLFSVTHSLSRSTAKLVDFICEHEKLFVKSILSSQPCYDFTSSPNNQLSVIVSSNNDMLSSNAAFSPQSLSADSTIRPKTFEQIRKQIVLKQSEYNILLCQLKELDISAGCTDKQNNENTEKFGDMKLNELFGFGDSGNGLCLPTSSDGVALLYRDEATTLFHRLSLSESMAKQVAEERAKLKEKLILKQQELDSTRDSYQQQLSAMSDHVCELNEQISIFRELQQATKDSNSAVGKAHLSFGDAQGSNQNYIYPGDVQFQPPSNGSKGSLTSTSSSSKKKSVTGQPLIAVDQSSSEMGASSSNSNASGSSLAAIGSNTLKSAGAKIGNIFR